MHEQLVPVFSYCLVEAGVRLFDPTQLHDARGRPYWVMSSWSPKLAAFQPPRTPVPRTSGENMVAAMDEFGKTGRVDDMGWLWRGMEYLYYPCQYSNRDGWVARYPVAFHGHVTRSPAYNCSPRSRWKLESPA